MGTISDSVHLQVNLKKIFKTFLIEDFLHFPLESTTPAVHPELQISQRIFENILNNPNGILRSLGESDS
jgi:hypothetical protein